MPSTNLRTPAWKVGEVKEVAVKAEEGIRSELSRAGDVFGDCPRQHGESTQAVRNRSLGADAGVRLKILPGDVGPGGGHLVMTGGERRNREGILGSGGDPGRAASRHLPVAVVDLILESHRPGRGRAAYLEGDGHGVSALEEVVGRVRGAEVQPAGPTLPPIRRDPVEQLRRAGGTRRDRDGAEGSCLFRGQPFVLRGSEPVEREDPLHQAPGRERVGIEDH